jgi:hypothetical protein
LDEKGQVGAILCWGSIVVAPVIERRAIDHTP